MDEERVAFIIAGVQKAGTTALFDYLSEEPGLSLSREKEVHFFDDETQDWAAPDYDAYHGRFAPADGRPRGEATPIYLYWPNSLERIRAYNPQIRLIVMLRDPVERAWSHWKMEYARGVETRPFAWSVREGRQRLFDVEPSDAKHPNAKPPNAKPWGFDREVSYVERGFYGEQMERLYGLFPREQVLILRSQELRDDPAAAMDQVRGFLALAGGPAPRAREVHVSAEMDYGGELTADDVAHLRSVYARDAERLADLTGVRFG